MSEYDIFEVAASLCDSEMAQKRASELSAKLANLIDLDTLPQWRRDGEDSADESIQAVVCALSGYLVGFCRHVGSPHLASEFVKKLEDTQ